MKASSSIGLVARGVVLLATEASGGEVARFDFEQAGQPEGWEVLHASRLVADGVLGGRATTPDPQLLHDPLERAGDAAWDTLTVKVRELDHEEALVPWQDVGVVLLFNAQEGTPATNFGTPRLASEADGDGFRTLSWDLSSFAGRSTGRIRLDPIGGPGTVRPGEMNNRFEVDSIVLTDTGVPAEPG